MSGEWRRGEYLISTDKARLDIDTIHGFLRGEHLGNPAGMKRVGAVIPRPMSAGHCLAARSLGQGLDPDKQRTLLLVEAVRQLQRLSLPVQ